MNSMEDQFSIPASSRVVQVKSRRPGKQWPVKMLVLASCLIWAVSACSPDTRSEKPPETRSENSVTGRVGRGFYEGQGPNSLSSYEYFVEYNIKNITPNELIFDRVEQHWIAGA